MRGSHLVSNIFNSDEKRNSAPSKPEPLTATTAKWSSSFERSKLDPSAVENEDYHKLRKE